MGWTWMNVHEEWKNGKRVIDRKKECDLCLTQEEHGNGQSVSFIRMACVD